MTSTADPPVFPQPMAHGYTGHAKSVRDPDERRRITEIKAEELDHRARVRAMLWWVFPKWDPPPPTATIRAGIAELASPA
jgi:rubrerythrin